MSTILSFSRSIYEICSRGTIFAKIMRRIKIKPRPIIKREKINQMQVDYKR